MFGKELGTMIKLLEQVLKELQISNETQKQLVTAVNRNTNVAGSLLVALETVRDKIGKSGETTYPDRLGGELHSASAEGPTEGNHYLGDGSSSHTGSGKKQSEGAGDCRSKCNGKCDDTDDDSDPTCA